MSKSDKREEIIKAAMELIAEQGFHGAPMALIAERAGVGAGTIYRYFENRDVLIKQLYKRIDENLKAFILDGYPENRPVREQFFHIGMGIINYFMSNPLYFRYAEQFHHSPYGIEFRSNKLFNPTGDYDFCRDLFAKGREQQVLKDVPMAVFINLAFAPVFWSLKDHMLGFINIDEPLAGVIVSSCWDSVKL